MTDDTEAARRRARQHTYLPVLSWVLVGLVFAWFAAWYFFYRPTGEERLQQAAFSEALDLIQTHYVEDVDREQLYQGAMRGMVGALPDPYSVYRTAVQMQQIDEDTRGEFGGIGIVLPPWPEKPVVDEVTEGGPADKAGIRAGDIITHVDGVEVLDMRRDKLVAMVRGEVGTTVELRVLREATGEELTFRIERGAIEVRNVKREMAAPGVGMLTLMTFDEDCSGEVRQALGDLVSEGAKGIIFDLRGNSGGLVKESILICDMFLDKGMILSTSSRGELTEPPAMATERTVLSMDVPVVVLVNGGTASASEIVAGSLQALDRATVVGTRTVGKGAVNQVFRLADGSGMVITVAHYQLAGGRIIQGNGVDPDVVAGEWPERPEGLSTQQLGEWYRENRAKTRAEQMDAALRVIRQKLGAD
jgi:carboxyl-terminal processing protease